MSAVVVLAIGGRAFWAYQQVKNNEVKVVDTAVLAPSGQATVNTQSVASSAISESGAQKDAGLLEAEGASCESRYGQISFCYTNNILARVINNCLQYVGVSDRVTECVTTQVNIVRSAMPQINSNMEKVSSFYYKPNDPSTISETGVLVCKDKNTQTTPVKIAETNFLAMSFCAEAVFTMEGSMCNKVDSTLFKKCSEGTAKYGKPQKNVEIEAIAKKYGEILGVFK